MAKVRESPKTSSLRRSTRKRAPFNRVLVDRLKFMQDIFMPGKSKEKNDEIEPIISPKVKSDSRYKRLQPESSDTEVEDNVAASTPKKIQIHPKRLKMTMTPVQSQNRLPPQTQPQVQQATQTPQSSDSQQIVLKKAQPSDVVWANKDVCAINFTSSSHGSSLFIFKGESKSISWQSPVSFCVIVLQGKFKCDQISEHLRVGDEIKVPAGKGIKVTHLGSSTKDGRILCFSQ